MKTLFLIAGKKRVGKDTLANMIGSKTDNPVVYRLADPIKRMLCALINIPSSQIEEINKIKENGDSVKAGKLSLDIRKLLQTLGTDWGRDTIDKEIWIQILIEEIKKDMSKDITPIVADIRFENEMNVLKERFNKDFNVVSIRIKKDIKDNDLHESEQGDFKVDYEIDNNGTLEELKENVDQFFLTNKVC